MASFPVTGCSSNEPPILLSLSRRFFASLLLRPPLCFISAVCTHTHTEPRSDTHNQAIEQINKNTHAHAHTYTVVAYNSKDWYDAAMTLRHFISAHPYSTGLLNMFNALVLQYVCVRARRRHKLFWLGLVLGRSLTSWLLLKLWRHSTCSTRSCCSACARAAHIVSADWVRSRRCLCLVTSLQSLVPNLKP